MASFAAQVSAFVRKTENKLDTAVRAISLEAFTRVIMRSPVDRGRFKGNWQVEIGSVPRGVVEIDDKNGTATISRMTAEIARLKAGETVYLINNLPYAIELEYGHSDQAPSGMVRLTVNEFEPIVAAIARELNRQ